METTTNKPPTSAGDGRGEPGTVKRPSPRPEMDEPKMGDSKPKSDPKLGLSESGLSGDGAGENRDRLLGADGQPIPIRNGRSLSETVDRSRELGRAAGESWKRVSGTAQDLARKNPSGTALVALGVGIVAGLVVGILFARD